VVAFDAQVTATKAKFKLGQDERRDVFADILAGLAADGDSELVCWMQAYAAATSDGAGGPGLAKTI
jgi:hypothetical protein